MKNSKIKLKNETHSIAVQSRLFELGYRWRTNKDSCITGIKFLYTSVDGLIFRIAYLNTFAEHPYKEITLNDLYDDRTLVKGKYYKIKQLPKFKFKFNGTFGNKTHYGFRSTGEWATDLGVHNNENANKQYVEIPEKEYFNALILEAEKRGFNNPGRIVTVGGTFYNITSPVIEKYQGETLIVKRDKGLIYKEGKWGNVIDSIELPIIGGIAGVDNGVNIIYGCVSFPKYILLTDIFTQIDKIVFNDGTTVSQTQLILIREYLRLHKNF